MQLGLPFSETATDEQPRSFVPSPSPEPRSPEPAPTIAFVRHSAAKRYVIRVRDDGSVRVTIPRWGSKRGAAEFVERERAWIDKQIERAAERRARQPIVRLTTDERHALVARARVELPSRLLELAEAHGLTVTRISIRNQRWRWGSCSRHGRICLNWRLVAMPTWVRDYVLVHELMHLRRMDHSPRFWKLVAGACPEYREARKWLRAHADLLADAVQ